MKIRWSRTGLVLCAVYGAFAIPSLIYGYGITGDFKGAYVLKQLAVFPAVVIAGLVLPQFLTEIPDIINNFFVFLFFSFMLIYGVGLIFGILGNFIFSRIYMLLRTKRHPRPPSRQLRVAKYLLATALFFGMT